MSVVTYNGVRMDLVKTNHVGVRPIMSSDKTQYLYTEWTHDFVALLNPENISYNAGGTATSGQLPSTTIQGIRHKLMQPRRTYIWQVGDETVITSPSGSNTTDMFNGPTTEAKIIAINGIRSWMVQMRITTYINECAELPVILSHRWRPSVDVNERFLSTRTITGEVEFNIPRLLQLRRGADNYRINLGHPVPRNFQRANIKVALSEDGRTVHYQFVDQERVMNIGSSLPLADLDVDITTGLSQGTTADVGKAFIGGAFGGLQQASQMSWGSGSISKFFQNPLVSVTQGVINGLINASSQLARMYIECTVTTVGRRSSTIRDMIDIASAIAFNRCAAMNFFTPTLTGMACKIHWDKKIVVWTQKHSQSGADWISSNGLDSIITTLETIIQRTQDFSNLRTNPNTHISGGNQFTTAFKRRISSLPDEFTYLSGKSITTADIGNPQAQTSGTSGSWLEKLVTQSLMEPCITPTLAMTNLLYRNKDERNYEN